MDLRTPLEELTQHFIVKAGPNKDKNQYGHLELWWAGGSVEDEPNALTNPWMMIADAQSSYSLACMDHLAGILDTARAALKQSE